MYIGNVALLILNLPLVGVWVSILRIPLQVLLPCIVLYAMIGILSWCQGYRAAELEHGPPTKLRHTWACRSVKRVANLGQSSPGNAR